jgi:two-component system LytT family response regulator
MTIRTVLIDDEIHCTESLDLILQKAVSQIKVVGKFNRPKDALLFLQANPVDLVFLDIEMPGMSGFDLLNALAPVNFDVIFVTAYDQYAIRAFSYSAVNYLLKPVDDEELVETIQRWDGNKKFSSQQFTLLQDIISNRTSPKTKVALPTSDGLEFLDINKIIRCESESNYTRIYCADKAKYLICRTLKEVEKVLSENGFVRIHHSHLINPHFIKRFSRQDGGYIQLENGEIISVSRTKKDQLFRLFEHVGKL